MFAFALLMILPSFSVSQSNETLLIRHLLAKQSPTSRPVYDVMKTINLTFGLEMVHIVSLQEVLQTIGIKVWLRMKWENEVIRWNPGKWGNITNTRANPENIWTPDVYLVEDTSSEISIGPSEYKTLVVMGHDGSHKWYVPALLDSSCRFDVRNFPFDRQICKFKFMSWTYDQKELDITLDPAAMITNYYVNSSEWELVGLKSDIVPMRYNCCPNLFVRVEYTLELCRKPLYYAFNVIAPCFIQMIIILFTFCLPPETGERVGVSVTVLLVFAVYLEVLSTSLPKTSISIPALSKFYLTAMAGSAFSIIATCFVLVIHFKGAEKGVAPLPNWVRIFFIQFLGKILCVKANLREHSNDELLALDKSAKEKRRNGYATRNWDSVEDVTATVYEQSEMSGEISVGSNHTMETLVDQVRIITSLIRDQNVQDEIEEEYSTLSKTFDRIFILMFLLYFFGCTMFVFLPVFLAELEHNQH